jgi:hypothetical protein
MLILKEKFDGRIANNYLWTYPKECFLCMPTTSVDGQTNAAHDDQPCVDLMEEHMGSI